MQRLLLGVLDKAILRLGDNTTVNFERSIVFLTSNLGARGMSHELRPSFGFDAVLDRPAPGAVHKKLHSIALSAVRKQFSPEFVNRIDVVSTYYPLDQAALNSILDHQIDNFRKHVHTRMGLRAFRFEISPQARKFLLHHGTSAEYGARELKRTFHKHLIQPLATLVARGRLESCGVAHIDWDGREEQLSFRCIPGLETLLA